MFFQADEADKANASFENGVLTVTIAKSPEIEAKKQKIEIKRAA